MGRAFILGAGFSAAAGLPTMANLFNRFFELQEGYPRDPSDYDDLSRNLAFFYPNSDLPDSGNYPNFEEFLSILEISRDFQDESDIYPGSTRDFDRYYNRTLSILAHTITTLQNGIDFDEESQLKAFVEGLSDDDVIITFNWDTLIEKQAARLNKQIDIYGRRGSTSLLKLHGSLSWVWLEPDILPNNYLEAITNESSEGQLYRSIDHSLLDTWTGIDRPPFIVTPIARKTPLDSNFVKDRWDMAMECIANASAVYIIGYSLPSQDYHARAMLRNAIDAKERIGGDESLVVINPDATVSARFSQYVSRNTQHIVQPFSNELIIR